MTTSILMTVNGNYEQPFDIVQRDAEGKETDRRSYATGPHSNDRGEQAAKQLHLYPTNVGGTVSLELRKDIYKGA